MRYSLAGTTLPLAVADYTYYALPRALQELLPTETELSTAADQALHHLTESNRARAGGEDHSN